MYSAGEFKCIRLLRLIPVRINESLLYYIDNDSSKSELFASFYRNTLISINNHPQSKVNGASHSPFVPGPQPSLIRPASTAPP